MLTVTEETINKCKLLAILQTRKKQAESWERLGKIMFIYKDRYGLTERTIKECVKECLFPESVDL